MASVWSDEVTFMMCVLTVSSGEHVDLAPTCVCVCGSDSDGHQC